MKRFITMVIFVTLLCASDALAFDADAIIGEWHTGEGNALVHIYKCGDLFCGKIVWLKKPKDKNGNNKMDIHNSDETKRRNPIVGLNIVWDFKYNGQNKWAGGKIYDPDNGKTYSCKMTLEGNNLMVRGFIGISLLGRTTVWTRKS